MNRDFDTTPKEVTVKTVNTYMKMLIPSFLVVSLTWFFTVRGRLYVCTDAIPIADWFPSHVHSRPEDYYVNEVGDYYIAPKRVVDTLWWISCGLIFVLAGVATQIVSHLR
jgi:hypothetical protein